MAETLGGRAGTNGNAVLATVQAGSRGESASTRPTTHTEQTNRAHVRCPRSSPRPVSRGDGRVWLGRPVRQDPSEFERDSQVQAPSVDIRIERLLDLLDPFDDGVPMQPQSRGSGCRAASLLKKNLERFTEASGLLVIGAERPQVRLHERAGQFGVPGCERQDADVVVHRERLPPDRAAHAFRFECLSVREAESG